MQRVFGDIDALRFVEDRLDPDRRSAFAAYLAENAEEFERVQLWTRQNEALRSAFGDVAGEAVPAWLLHGVGSPEPAAGPCKLKAMPSAPSIDAASSRLMAPSSRLSGLRNRGGLIGICVALLAVTALSLTAADSFALIHRAGTSPEEPGLTTHAVDAFRTYALDPVRAAEIPAAQETDLEQWIQRRTGLAVRPPDLRAEGWSYLGGRVVPGGADPGALLIYENSGKDRLALFFDHASAPPADARVEAFAGGSMMAWTSGSGAFAIATDKDSDWISREGSPLRAKVEAALQPAG